MVWQKIGRTTFNLTELAKLSLDEALKVCHANDKVEVEAAWKKANPKRKPTKTKEKKEAE